jgi:hypothetical protein
VNYLPSEIDASFNRGKAVEAISRKYGVVNPMCACTYSPSGGSEQLAFVSHKGIHSTDGARFDNLTDDLDWRQVISLTSTSTPIALVDDPEEQVLRFFYRNDSFATEKYLQLLIHYDTDQVRISGPVHMRNYDSAAGGTYASLESAWTVPRSNGGTSLYLGYGGSSVAAGAGKVYLETGTTIPANDSAMQFTTRRMYLAGLGNEFRLDNLHGYAGSYAGSPVVSYTPKTTKTNDTGETTQGTKSITLAGSKLHRVSMAQAAEGLRLSVSVTGTTYGQQNILLDGTGFGDEDSGR